MLQGLDGQAQLAITVKFIHSKYPYYYFYNLIISHSLLLMKSKAHFKKHSVKKEGKIFPILLQPSIWFCGNAGNDIIIDTAIPINLIFEAFHLTPTKIITLASHNLIATNKYALFDWGTSVIQPTHDPSILHRIDIPNVKEVDSIKNALIYSDDTEKLYVGIPKCEELSKVTNLTTEFYRKEITGELSTPISFTSIPLTLPENTKVYQIACGFTHCLILTTQGLIFSL